MIEYKTGNLLEADVQALINTVNCVGVMGKGIALQFKQAFPKNYNEYVKACNANLVVPGKMFIVDNESLLNPRYIINFPTKRHWKGKSRIEDIEGGLVDLMHQIRAREITSVAVPPLGCGNGGLNWEQVQPLIEQAAEQLPNVMFWVYPPSGSPQPDKIKIGTKRPKLTRARALIIMLMNHYGKPGYRLSLLEIQKLAYFLQEEGEPLKLQYEKGKYGPYAENLNHVLQRLEGHFIRGYGDRSREAQVYLLPDIYEEARSYLEHENDPGTMKKLESVKTLIEGYETPYGLELLSTAHWIMKTYSEARTDQAALLHHFFSWNDRKKEVFKKTHILKAWEHLKKTTSVAEAVYRA
ncbi:macro domain-containing protein [uncultured Paenibacillus sp.]|uniref:type II toxin-antitoxin system antitoxin DNA ADP-ribosyl glycohydrolase DarG n=1 Tax=uncultured Paenibacillus sp. TaxID=227322 RepID=UPI0028D349EC|nr:macro domain-containing protein [uncultured Paenibacillus sp.]